MCASAGAQNRAGMGPEHAGAQGIATACLGWGVPRRAAAARGLAQGWVRFSAVSDRRVRAACPNPSPFLRVCYATATGHPQSARGTRHRPLHSAEMGGGEASGHPATGPPPDASRSLHPRPAYTISRSGTPVAVSATYPHRSSRGGSRYAAGLAQQNHRRRPSWHSR